MARSGLIGQNIDIGIKFFNNGQLFDPFKINSVKIFSPTNKLLATLTPKRISIGFYQVTWDTPSGLDAGTYNDQWTWQAEDTLPFKTQKYSFELKPAGIPSGASESEAAIAEAGCRPKPTWLHLVGIRRIEDVGNGMGLRLTWGEAVPNDPDKQIHYNIYNSTTRFGVFYQGPDLITTARQVVVNVSPGQLQYFAVRATEFDPKEFIISDMEQVGIDLFSYPDDQPLQEDLDAYSEVITVPTTNGFPNKGFIKINSEVMQYNTKSGTEFTIVEGIGRGAIQTLATDHSAGSTVELWKGVEDANSVILNETAAWHESFGTPRNVDKIGEANVGPDGYRSANKDIITPDFTISDEENVDFPTFDFKGYRRPSIQDLFSGDCENSYVGGEFGGLRGFNFQERNLARLDKQLQITGEPVVLFKRKWSGKRCSCISLRREHPRTRCPNCFGTGFEGGYNRYINSRPISQRFDNEFGMILIRVQPYSDDLEIVGDQGLVNPTTLSAWTITVPSLKDRDLIVRFTRDPDTGKFIEEFRYEILDVTRNVLVLGDLGRQMCRLRRHDKTDVVYQLDTGV